MTKNIKHICADFILFPDVSEDDFNYLLKESMTCKFNRKELWKNYQSLTSMHDQRRIHIFENKIVFIKEAS